MDGCDRRRAAALVAIGATAALAAAISARALGADAVVVGLAGVVAAGCAAGWARFCLLCATQT